MSQNMPTGGEGSQPPAGARPDAALTEFRSALIAGRHPRIEDFLAGTPDAGRPSLVRGLVTLELAYRLRIGERPTLEEYLARFPGQERAIESAFHHSAVAPALDGASISPDASRITPGREQADPNRPRVPTPPPARCRCSRASGSSRRY